MLTPIVRANSDPSSDLGSEPVLCFLQLLKTATRIWYQAVYRVCDAHAVNLQQLDFDRITFCTLTTAGVGWSSRGSKVCVTMLALQCQC